MFKEFLMKRCGRIGIGSGTSIKCIFILCIFILCVNAQQMSTTTEDDDLAMRKSYSWRWQSPLSYLQRRNLFSNEDNYASFDDKIDLKQDADLTDNNANLNGFNDNQYLENVLPNFNLNEDYNKRRSPFFSIYNAD